MINEEMFKDFLNRLEKKVDYNEVSAKENYIMREALSEYKDNHPEIHESFLKIIPEKYAFYREQYEYYKERVSLYDSILVDLEKCIDEDGDNDDEYDRIEVALGEVFEFDGENFKAKVYTGKSLLICENCCFHHSIACIKYKCTHRKDGNSVHFVKVNEDDKDEW